MALGVASPCRSRFEPSARTQEGAEAKARIEEPERLVGRQQLDLDFFRKALRLADALPRAATRWVLHVGKLPLGQT
jgi:hypothetical protein